MIVGLFVRLCIALVLGMALLRVRERNRQLASAINQILGNFSLWDARDRIVLSNQRFLEDLGTAAGSVPEGSTFDQYIWARFENGLVPQADSDAEA